MTTTENTVQTDPATTRRFALAAAELAANTRGENVVLLDLRDRSPVTEFFIIATGTSPRQMRTVAEEIQELGKRMGFKAWHTSGLESAKWILVDCVSVVAHIFDNDSRDFYDLELLWGDCPRIDWRKELGLPPQPEGQERTRTRINFGQSAGLEDIDAEEEDARLDGDDLDEEEGDADMDEDAEEDAPIVMEFPDESTGSNSVEFVEVESPSKRRKRGRTAYPTPIADEDLTEEERSISPVGDLGGASQSTDEDDQERDAENEADGDVEAVSKEDLPASRIRSVPMGGVSSNISGGIADSDEEDQSTDLDAADREQDHKDDVTEAQEAAAETTSFAKPVDGEPGVYISLEGATEIPPGGRKLRSRASERGPKPGTAAPGRVNVNRAKAGVVKGKARKGVEGGLADAPATTAPKKPVVKMSRAGAAKKPAPAKRAPAAKAVTRKAPAKKAPAKKVAAKKPAPRKAAAKKAPVKKPPAKKPAAKKAAPKKAAAKKSTRKR
jgi:ribosome-associated protein